MSVIKTIAGLKAIEKVDAKVSKKYVPIFTSDFVEAMSNFEFSHAIMYWAKSGYSAHQAVLTAGEGTNIIIENSYDRSLGFSIQFEHDGVIFGRVRQIHMGKSAAELAHMESEVNDFYTGAIQTLHAMKNLQLDNDEYKEMARAAFKARDVDVDKTDFKVEAIQAKNCFEFIQALLLTVKSGNYTRENQKRSPQPIKAQSKYVNICSKLWKHIIEEHPELQI